LVKVEKSWGIPSGGLLSPDSLWEANLSRSRGFSAAARRPSICSKVGKRASRESSVYCFGLAFLPHSAGRGPLPWGGYRTEDSRSRPLTCLPATIVSTLSRLSARLRRHAAPKRPPFPRGFAEGRKTRWCPRVSTPPNALGARRPAVSVPRDVTAGAHAPPDPAMLRLGWGA
jgi:hypothetical protein